MKPDTKANIVAAVAAAFILFALIGTIQTGSSSVVSSIPVTSAVEPTGDNRYEEPGDHILGSADAPVTIIEYASLTCGHCATFHENVFKKLEEAYINTGKVRFIFREFPTPPADRAVAGFMLANCLPAERYFGIIDVLFKQQGKWVNSPDTYGELKKIGQLAGLNAEEFDECLRNEDEVKRIQDIQKIGSERYGINSTPSFVIEGKTYTNMPWDQLQAALDPLLAE